jgi:hypothetical protein
MKAHSTPGLTLVHRIGIIPFQFGFGIKKTGQTGLSSKEILFKLLFYRILCPLSILFFSDMVHFLNDSLLTRCSARDGTDNGL